MTAEKNNSSTRSAIVICDSIAGLTTELALVKRGWDVHVYESTKANLASRGAGIVTHQILFDTLYAPGLSISDEVGVTTNTRKTFATDGNVGSISAGATEQPG